jgi:hypothetical protein
MAAATIDYDKLAQQAGAKGVDYDALAAQHGAITVPPTTQVDTAPDNSFGKFDTNTKTSPNEPLLETGLKSVVGTIGAPLVHPLQTGKALLQSIPHMSPYDPQNPIGAPITQAVSDYQEAGGGRHGVAYAGTKALGNTFGSAALADAGAAPLRFVNRVAAPAAVQAGEDTINSGLLGVPSKVLRNGHNPARGLSEQGLLPAITRTQLERGIDERVPAIGNQISDLVRRGNPVPAANLVAPIENPILNAGEVTTGFGGRNATEPLADLWQMMERKAPGASAPIYGPSAPQAVSAQDLWHSRLNLDANTKFNPNPEIESVNEVRRDIRGGLQDQLVGANQELAQPSQDYGDLRAAQEALEKKPGKGVGKLMDLAKTPVLSTSGLALMKGGRLAGNLTANPFLNRIPGVASLFYAAPKSGN